MKRLEQFLDVAVVEIKLPRMDGVETQRQVKTLQPFLQRIVLTATLRLNRLWKVDAWMRFFTYLNPLTTTTSFALIKTLTGEK